MEVRGLLIRKWKNVLGTILIVSFLITPSLALASDYQKKLVENQQQYYQLNNELVQNRQQESSATARLAGLQQTINNLNNAIASQQAKLEKQQQELQALDQKQKDLDAQKQDLVRQLGLYLRTNYEQGPLIYLDVLLGANSLTDLLDKVEQVRYIVRHYDNLQDKIGEVSEQVEEQKTTIQQKTVELTAALEEQKVSEQAVRLSMQKEQDLLAQLSAKEKAVIKAKSQAQANIEYLQEMMRQEAIDAENAKNQPITGGSGGGITTPVQVSAKVSEILAYAQSFIGVPYQWGGTTPNGFDCSGFVQYVFAHFGVNLARVSFDQYKEGIAVASSDLLPGDLVFFTTYAPGASHVGIYLGNDNIIDAEPHGIAVARLFGNQYKASKYLGARRVIK